MLCLHTVVVLLLLLLCLLTAVEIVGMAMATDVQTSFEDALREPQLCVVCCVRLLHEVMSHDTVHHTTHPYMDMYVV